MNHARRGTLCLLFLLIAVCPALAQAPADYQIYFGTTHAHTSYSGDSQREGNTPAIHYTTAKKNGFQFYIITDHSHYDTFTPETFAATQKEALKFTDKDFVALHGFEYSENNGPGGKGHLNAINTPTYLNALLPGNDLNKFYGWLVEQGKTGQVMASFNHPGLKQYNDWDYFSDDRRDMITMLEVINGARKKEGQPNVIVGNVHYEDLLCALDKGWRVSPVAGLDAHSPMAIPKASYRTAILATSLTRDALLDAMKHRRTYATYDKNLHALYTVNGAIMGSVLPKADRLKFDIRAWDPDVNALGDRITKIEIVGEGGVLVDSKVFDAYNVEWKPELDAKYKYYLLKVYTADNNTEPTAWLAPVWTGK